MKNIKYLLSLLILSTLCCKKIVEKKDLSKDSKKSRPCFSSNDKIEILNNIFESDYMLKHMDPRIKKSETDLKILENNFLSNISNMAFRNRSVQFIDSLNLTDDTFRLTFTKIDCKEKSLSFLLKYPIEGNWYAEGNVVYIDGKLETEITSGGISD